MKEVVPWTRFLDVIEPLYPKRCARALNRPGFAGGRLM
jgi:hypothetical protein